MFIKIVGRHAGSHPAMPIVDIVTADGETVQFEVSDRSIADARVSIGWPVGRRDDGALLVEFGTQYGCLTGGRHFGAHRVYVPAGDIVPAPTESGGEGEGEP
jgi:hypothetical protein